MIRSHFKLHVNGINFVKVKVSRNIIDLHNLGSPVN